MMAHMLGEMAFMRVSTNSSTELRASSSLVASSHAAIHCRNLTTINLYDCANITEKAKATLRKSCKGITING